jgi:hypothetical protein
MEECLLAEHVHWNAWHCRTKIRIVMKTTATKRAPSVDEGVEIVSAQLPTRFGQFRMFGFRYRGIEAAALVAGDPALADAPLDHYAAIAACNWMLPCV